MGNTKWVTWFDVKEYPDSDGEPIAENTVQYRWITLIERGLQYVFGDEPNVFVAADLFWYPVEGNNTIRRAPDGMVAIGRPKGPRLAYLQWLEGGIAPQVVFEVLSPSNRGAELARKFEFYEKYGVDEYYIYDPDFHRLEGWGREGDRLRQVPEMNGWISPRLGVRFETVGDQFRLFGPDNQPFVSALETAHLVREYRRFHDEYQRLIDEFEPKIVEQKRRTDEFRRQIDEQERRCDEFRRQAKEYQRPSDELRRQAEEYQRHYDEFLRQADEYQRRCEHLAAQRIALGIERPP